MSASRLLKIANQRIFKHAEFRGDQEAICTAAVGGSDILAVMPTGAGKSLCYQLPATIGFGLTVVISPLLSLMHDQVTTLVSKDIAAIKYTSELTVNAKACYLDMITRGMITLLYLAPETLISEQEKDADLTRALLEIHAMAKLKRFVPYTDGSLNSAL